MPTTSGRAEEDLPVEFAGEPLTIAFNPTYLTDGLGSLHSERVTFGFTTPSRPAVLRPAGDDEDGTVGATRPVPGRSNRLRLSVDAGAAPGLTGSTATKEAHMQLGLIGLGKMGFNMRERLREGGHEVVGYDPRPEVTDVPTLAALADALTAPRVVWVMVPSGAVTDDDHRGTREGAVRRRSGDRRWELALHRR